jgi:hypothetical protein
MPRAKHSVCSGALGGMSLRDETSEGRDFRILRRPFDIERIRVSTANYGQGVIRFAYVDTADEKAILEGNMLEGA